MARLIKTPLLHRSFELDRSAVDEKTRSIVLSFSSEAPVERLYREIRALRIYEGATEVQKLIIARELLKEAAANVAT